MGRLSRATGHRRATQVLANKADEVPSAAEWFCVPPECRKVRPSALMCPEHPAGDEVAEHRGGDERDSTQENGNKVATFHPLRHSSPLVLRQRIAGLLRHSQVRTTQRTAQHVEANRSTIATHSRMVIVPLIPVNRFTPENRGQETPA